MTKSDFRFTFKPVTLSECEWLIDSLKQDYICEWLHGQGLKNLLFGLDKFINAPDDEKITAHWLGYDREVPFVYLLTSNVSKDEPNEYAKYSELKGSAITLDIFILNPDYLGKGLAPLIIKEFLLNQFPRVTEVFIDPEQSNKRAVHVYQKTGFRIVGEFVASWHPVPHYVMKLKLQDISLTID